MAMIAPVPRNVCFRCHQPGHWAASCPERTCDFCSHKGHTVDCCKMKDALHVPVPETRERVTRTRSRATPLSLADIMFNCHLENAFSREMEEQVVALAKSVCKRGIDEHALAEYVLVHQRNSFSVLDPGHMAVLGFIIKKYLSADNPFLKSFLNEIKDEVSGFDRICKYTFGLVVVRRQNGTTCFRKGNWAI